MIAYVRTNGEKEILEDTWVLHKKIEQFYLKELALFYENARQVIHVRAHSCVPLSECVCMCALHSGTNNPTERQMCGSFWQ